MEAGLHYFMQWAHLPDMEQMHQRSLHWLGQLIRRHLQAILILAVLLLAIVLLP